MKQNSKKLFILQLHPSMIVTFLGILLGIISLCFASLKDFKLALSFLTLAGICDAFDGAFANKFKRSNEDKLLGIQFDSLADITISGFLPVCILISMGFNKFYNIIIYFLFIFAGIYRLAFFNVHTSEDKKYFTGFPITLSTIVFPLLYLFTKMEIFFMTVMIILSILFILNIKLKKPNLKLKIILSIIGILIISYVIIMKVNL